MVIPEYFKEKIIRSFGVRGEEWLIKLPGILQKSIEKWHLEDMKISENLSYNFICFADSPDYGKIALKIGVPHRDLYTEMEALSLYKGRHICRCYDFDKELGAMLLERITPGHDLTCLNNNKEELIVAADLIAKMPIPVKGAHDLPTYNEWVNKAFLRARKENLVGSKMLKIINETEKWFDDLDRLNRDTVLLHGDLHHWNILQNQKRGWKAIDPKGVMGIPCMESARFMDNHLDRIKDSEKLEGLDEMVKVFSSKFHETKLTLAICLLVLVVLSTCWSFEDAKPEPNHLLDRIERCELIFHYTNTLR